MSALRNLNHTPLPLPLRVALPLLLALSLLLGACVAPVATSDAPAADSAAADSGAADSAAAPAEITAYANPDLLVDTAWVKEHLADPNVRFLALHGKQEDFDAGHLPGAIFVNTSELANPDNPIAGEILTADQLTALAGRLGIENDDTLVLYDSNDNLWASRGYWVFKYYQHPNVLVYNGGTKRWTTDGEALVTEATAALPASAYVAGAADEEIRTTGEYVLSKLEDPQAVLCDTRGVEEFAGVDVRSARGGHIPGAINLDWTLSVNKADGTFLSAPELATLYQSAGFTPDKEIITYCQTGIRGAHTWFVLRELLGYPTVRNYDGSWEEWGNDESFPIEQ